jgi:hypothetical protein
MYPVRAVTYNYISNLKRVPSFRTKKQRPDRAVALIIVRLPSHACMLSVCVLSNGETKKQPKRIRDLLVNKKGSAVELSDWLLLFIFSPGRRSSSPGEIGRCRTELERE